MKVIYLIAINSFRQTLRERLFYNVILFGVGLLMLALVVSDLTFGFPDRVVRSIGHSAIVLAMDLMALLLGVTAVYQEIDRKSLFVLLTRPLSRAQYVSGKFIGLMGALALVLVGLVVIFVLVLTVVRGHVTGADILAFGAALVEASILAGVGLVLSAFTTPTLGAGMGLGAWIAMASTDNMVELTRDQPVLGEVSKWISWILPSLARLDFREAAVHQFSISASGYGLALAYGATQALLLVGLAAFILERREMV